MTNPAQQPNPFKRIFCNQCRTATNHFVKITHVRREDAPEDDWWSQSEFRLWICAGCETASLEEEYTNSAMDYYTYSPESTFYPKRAHSDLPKKRFQQLPENLSRVYRETIDAFNAGLAVLCTAGLRTLIEGICSDKGIRGRSLKERIDGLGTLLPQNIVANLHTFRFMGNVALHELSAPVQGDLIQAIEICEDLLNFLYELDYKARRLTASRKGEPRFALPPFPPLPPLSLPPPNTQG